MNHNENSSFHFRYSAEEQEDVRNIRKKYLPQNDKEDKVKRVKQLDQRATDRATVFSLIAGILGILLFGLGMSCCLVWQGSLFIPGIFIGLSGISLLSFAYPIYKKVLVKESEKIAPEILRLTDELMK